MLLGILHLFVGSRSYSFVGRGGNFIFVLEIFNLFVNGDGKLFGVCRNDYFVG